MRHATLQAAVAVGLLFSVAACTCGSKDGSTHGTYGEPAIEVVGEDGKISLVTDVTVDFGATLVGSRVERKLVLRN